MVPSAKPIGRIPVLLAGVLLCLMTHPSKQAQMLGQEQPRVLERLSFPFEPIEITDVRIKGQSIKFSPVLTDNVDWLQGLTVQVKNISGKPISYISIELWVHPPESGNRPTVTTIASGQVPLSSAEISQPAKVLVAPNASTEITLNDSAYTVYKNELHASKVQVRVGMVFFTDNTAWKEGVLLRRDKTKPNRWNVIKDSERRLEEFLKQ
jgi:hypothetical protein